MREMLSYLGSHTFLLPTWYIQNPHGHRLLWFFLLKGPVQDKLISS